MRKGGGEGVLGGCVAVIFLKENLKQGIYRTFSLISEFLSGQYGFPGILIGLTLSTMCRNRSVLLVVKENSSLKHKQTPQTNIRRHQKLLTIH